MAKGVLSRVQYGKNSEGVWGYLSQEEIPPYVYQAYPCWRFHPTEASRVFENENDLLAVLAEDDLWRDRPYSDKEVAEFKAGTLAPSPEKVASDEMAEFLAWKAAQEQKSVAPKIGPSPLDVEIPQFTAPRRRTRGPNKKKAIAA